MRDTWAKAKESADGDFGVVDVVVSTVVVGVVGGVVSDVVVRGEHALTTAMHNSGTARGSLMWQG